jgi:hypothetical protein
MKTRPVRKKTSKAETLALIRSARGMIKPRPGEKPFAKEWAEYKAGEMVLEAAKLRRVCR